MKKRKKNWETNRDTARKPRIGKFWCDRCDGYLVGPGTKCPRCGKKQLPKRNRK